MYCPTCNKMLSDKAQACPNCGHPFDSIDRLQNSIDRLQNKLTSTGNKSKVTFVLLALLLGGLGIHRMYIASWSLGIIYLLFCWTFIPMLVAVIEAIVIGLRKNDPRFE